MSDQKNKETNAGVELPAHVKANRQLWDDTADQWVGPGERSWASAEPYWGIWQLPESDLKLLPVNMSGMQTIELGCGTGYVSAWMARRGAQPFGIDNSAKQLETAQRLMREHSLHFEVMHGNAESVPKPDASFDFAISEYGAAIWCDPEMWLPEAHRLLRSGGQLVFLGNHPLAMLCAPESGALVDTSLHRSYFDLGKLDWREVEIDPGGVEFNRSISSWMRLFDLIGFDIERYQELQAPQGASGTQFYVSAEWAQSWPSEQVWHLRKR